MDNQENKIINIWKFIEFTNTWNNCDTSKLDEISPSWFRRKEELEKTSSEYTEFMSRLKRQHAIETGIVERMYDLSKGVTETLIEKGFADTLISHGDFSENMTKDELMNHLKDHLAAVDSVFEFVKSNRQLTIGFIYELHQIVTQHQQWAEGRDQFGNKHKIQLLKGKFKERENNPSRQDGDVKITYRYCPPEHVDAEMDNLLLIYEQLIQQQIHPLIIAAWFHHSFTIIHPFQDGNGRMARLLASLIFIKFGFFPLTVLREEAKDIYIKSLEEADQGKPQPIVDYFVDIQRKNIEKALNLKSVSASTSFNQLADILSSKLKTQKERLERERLQKIESNRLSVFQICNNVLKEYERELIEKMSGTANIYLTACSPTDVGKQHYFTHQIVKFANKHNYYYNRFLPKAWFRFVFEISDQKSYQLIVTLHHFGYEDDSFAIGALLEFIESEDVAKNIRNLTDDNFRKDSDGMIITYVPLDIKPYKISLETENINERQANIKNYLNDILTLTLAQIASEIT
ncbi:MAG: Fic family protein [Daejeonella sp.]